MARGDPRKTKGDVAGVFAADEVGVGSVEIVERDFETFALVELPLLEHGDQFPFAMTRDFSGDDEAEVAGSMCAAIMFANIFELDVVEGFDAVGEAGIVLADGLLEFWPKKARIFVLVAGELGADVAFFAF